MNKHKLLLRDALIINEGASFHGSVLINGQIIEAVFNHDIGQAFQHDEQIPEINAKGLTLFPGVIDTHVHFREPGMTHKGDLRSESKAAVAGGVTSIIDMPNTVPQTITTKTWEEKMAIAAERSLTNFSFYLGVTNDNWHELYNADPEKIAGLKVFTGASTGNMLMEDEIRMRAIFEESPHLIAVHSEDEQTIRDNMSYYRDRFGDGMPFRYHSSIRSEEACVKSTRKILDMAVQTEARLHLLHITTAMEVKLIEQYKAEFPENRITFEICPSYLWFYDNDYDRLCPKIKCNPAIKRFDDRAALRDAVASGLVDVVGSDHAPHTWAEKDRGYFDSPSGMPSVQFSLPMMFTLCSEGIFTVERLVELMCHAPAKAFGIDKRGFVRPGYYADLVLFDSHSTTPVSKERIVSPCKWSPWEGVEFKGRVVHTWVNGNHLYRDGVITESTAGMSLSFNR
jgi:dihydroorotase